MPSLEDYWNLTQTKGDIFGNTFIKNKMGRYRYILLILIFAYYRWLQIHAVFTCNLEWLQKHLINAFKEWYIPQEAVAVDETLILFKGDL